ncbi:MAG TPA: hypothetical protein VIK55_18845 [Paludibacter sp.]
MNWFNKLFGSNAEKTKVSEVIKNESKKGSSDFPNSMMGKVNMVIINYEGQKNRDLQQNVVNHLMPLMRNGGGFVCYCNASISPLASGEPECAMINASGGYPVAGVSLDSYMAYFASKDSFPSQSPAYGREYSFNQIGYWVGKQNGQKVHAVLLF